MRITKKSSYAINIIGELIDNPSIMVSSTKLAEKYKLDIGFINQVLCNLKNAKVLNSKKGPGGGYTLNIDASKITPEMIMLAVDEDFKQSRQINKSANQVCKNFVERLDKNLLKFMQTPILNFKKSA